MKTVMNKLKGEGEVANFEVEPPRDGLEAAFGGSCIGLLQPVSTNVSRHCSRQNSTYVFQQH